ncbi:unnamed protein product [Arabis nemorensis]|uniref:Pyruvate kinase n=1 Tax=Arabis nemorensis TaxID=586526 RepID=A0A565BRK4_9BRAS|nr:unnamed protein product [Arabis nemorensis]
MPPQWIITAQKSTIEKVNALGKPVVTAIQMLDSASPRPTSAEANDVANAVLEGTDCVMLSGVTAAGAHPETVVQTMSRLCKEAEDSIDYRTLHMKIRTLLRPLSKIERTAVTAVTIVARKMNAKASCQRSQEWIQGGGCGQVQAERSYSIGG